MNRKKTQFISTKIIQRSLKYALLYSFVRLIPLFSFLPLNFLKFSFKNLSLLYFYSNKKIREITVNNVKRVDPNKSTKACYLFAKEVFKYLGINIAYIFKSFRVKTLDDFEKLVTVRGKKNLSNLLNKGHGVLLISCHMGAFELCGTYVGLAHRGIAVGAKLKQPKLDNFLVHYRKRMGLEYYVRGEGTLTMLKGLKSGRVLGMLIDQDTDKVKNVFVDFFGIKTSTPSGAALLAQKTGCKVLPIRAYYENGKQIITIDSELIPITITDDEQKDLIINTQRISNVLEKYIREKPHQWLWFHERWKSRPLE